MAIDINAARLWETILETARVGGTDEGGVRRLALSQEDKTIRDWFCAECEKLGAHVEVDTLGTIFAHYPGRSSDAKPVAMGSHLDTQPTGGKFDGILGVLAGLEVLRTLSENNITPEKPIVLVDWTNEEGARFAPSMGSSAAFANVLPVEEILSAKDRNGITFEEALEEIGYRGDLPLGKVEFDSMFELHIEQGPILEAEETTIGIVTGAQGMRWYDISIKGMAAHAGTTPMHLRRDAFMTAAELSLELRRMALDAGANVTIGEFSIPHASRNVIPGEVNLTLDIRHPEEAVLNRLEQALDKLCSSEITATTDVTVRRILDSAPIVFDETCIDLVEQAIEQRQFSSRRILSGAGHDSVNISRIAPTVMIFVPCMKGISHNPAESITAEDAAAGAQVLLDAVLLRAGI
ncbi:N-carbamoyl-L-amino-acid hydrolase [Halomonadaceae bacterium LMG 33818]|uniref:M20 family metallo-hydrolase n=1 Tax=Cernens ardua TaxID=3402176 RepID=UPI003EDC3A11